MDVLRQFLVFVVYGHTVPDARAGVFIGQFIKDAVASKNYEIMVFCNFEGLYVRFANNHIWVSSSELIFRLWIPKGS